MSDDANWVTAENADLARRLFAASRGDRAPQGTRINALRVARVAVAGSSAASLMSASGTSAASSAAVAGGGAAGSGAVGSAVTTASGLVGAAGGGGAAGLETIAVGSAAVGSAAVGSAAVGSAAVGSAALGAGASLPVAAAAGSGLVLAGLGSISALKLSAGVLVLASAGYLGAQVVDVLGPSQSAPVADVADQTSGVGVVSASAPGAGDDRASVVAARERSVAESNFGEGREGSEELGASKAMSPPAEPLEPENQQGQVSRTPEPPGRIRAEGGNGAGPLRRVNSQTATPKRGVADPGSTPVAAAPAQLSTNGPERGGRGGTAAVGEAEERAAERRSRVSFLGMNSQGASTVVPSDSPQRVATDQAGSESNAAEPSEDRRAEAQSARLADELGLIRRAHSALRAGKTNEAVAWLDRYARRYPSGKLRPEAAQLRRRIASLRGQ